MPQPHDHKADEDLEWQRVLDSIHKQREETVDKWLEEVYQHLKLKFPQGYDV